MRFRKTKARTSDRRELRFQRRRKRKDSSFNKDHARKFLEEEAKRYEYDLQALAKH